MTRLFSMLAAFCIATPLAAAELSERYQVIGTITAQLGDETLNLVIPYDTEKDRAYADQSMIMGSFLTINLLGRTVEADGTPGRPMLQITLQQRGSEMDFLSAEVFDDQGFDAPLSMGLDGGAGTLVEFDLDEANRTTGRIEGQFLRLTGYTGEPRVADGATPVSATIQWRAELAPLD